jgi:hypothetical protein
MMTNPPNIPMSTKVIQIMRIVILMGLTVSTLATVNQASGMEAKESGYIAGSNPGQRPQNAPAISQVQKGYDWYQQALTGITTPYPSSLRFLEDQGNWHTPFNHPGMTSRYDIRGWHK